MNEVFQTTLSMSCSGALLIAVLRLLRPFFRTRLSQRWQYYIWLVVAARLLLPFATEINLMGTLFQNASNEIAPSESILSPGQDAYSAPASLNGDVGMILNRFFKEQPDGETEMGALQNKRPDTWIWNSIWLCWLVTALVLLIRKLTIYQSFVQYVRAGCAEVTDIELLEQFGRLVEQSNLTTAVELYTNGLVSSPLLIGFFRPCIVLPTAQLSDAAFQYTILHELTHYKRRDMFYKWLIQLTVCLHWFNPLVWLMSREVERTCELSCDEAVIKGLDAQERRAYGDTLLSAMGNGGSYKSKIASVTLSESGAQLRERLNAIAGFRNPSKCARFLAAALTVAICLGAAAAGAYAADPWSADEAAPPAKPQTIGALTLLEKEYTVEELKTLGISELVVGTHSDDVSVVRGGDTLKVQYYALGPEEYSFRHLENYFTRQWSLSISRPPSNVGDGRSMIITIPEQFQFSVIQIATTSGNIGLTDCTAGSIMADSQNGRIDIQGGSAAECFRVNTQVGDVLVSDTVLPDSEKNASSYSAFHTVSGTIIVQPPDSAEQYCLMVDYGEEAEVFINKEGVGAIDMLDCGEAAMTVEADGTVPGEITEFVEKLAFTLNEDAPKKISFHSLKGTLILQEK